MDTQNGDLKCIYEHTFLWYWYAAVNNKKMSNETEQCQDIKIAEKKRKEKNLLRRRKNWKVHFSGLT